MSDFGMLYKNLMDSLPEAIELLEQGKTKDAKQYLKVIHQAAETAYYYKKRTEKKKK